MTQTQKEVRNNKRAESAPRRKALIETAKTFFIVVSVTAALAFAGGVKWANSQQAHVQGAVKNAVNTAQTASK